MVQRTVLHYQIGEKIGVGGMGEIYKARDTRLNRFVAIKALSPAMSADPDRRRRFIQEAQAVSSLNHPNIITIFDIVDDGGTQYMVVEYVDGKTLLELIPKGGMPVPLVLRYATQMAEALCAAHAAGIIHRDLKPANVMVTGNGLVKVLDFGLAKLIDWAAADPGGPTVTMQPAPLTVEGTLLGTVNYMSPEQAEGKKTDARSDVFSFGAVLYEMLTGLHAFRGDSVIATLTAVLRDDIQPLRELAPEVPADLERIVDGCLKKNPDERIQTIEEVHAALSALKQKWDSVTLGNLPPVASMAPRAPARRSPVPVLAAIFILTALAGGYWWMNNRRAAPQPNPQSTAPAATASPASVTASNDAPAGPSSDAVTPAPAPAPTPVPVPDGLPIRLTLTEDIPSDAAEGDAVHFTVAKDIRVTGVVVIRKGAAAVGAIVDSPKKRIFGLGTGKMTFRLDTVEAVDGQKLSIRATSVVHGQASKQVVDNGVKKPKEIAAAEGTPYSGYIDGAKTVTVKK